VIKRNTCLKFLDLKENKIGNFGVQYLALALVDNTSLTHIYLRKNFIDNCGAISLAQMLAKNSSLEILHLEHNFIKEGTQHLPNSLRENKTLKFFYLKNNSIFSQGAAYFAENIKRNNNGNDRYNSVGTFGFARN